MAFVHLGSQRLSITKNQVVTLTVVNPDLSKTIETQIALQGAAVASASGTVLAASDMHAHNTFDHPNAVTAHNSRERGGRRSAER